MAEKITEEEIIRQIEQEYEQKIMDELDKNVPTPQSKDSFFKLINEILDRKDSTKTANLTHEELGKTELSMRGCLKLSLMSQMLGEDELAQCFDREAEITASTSMSRYVKGSNFLNLMFTQIRKSISGTEQKPEKKRFSFFGSSGDNND